MEYKNFAAQIKSIDADKGEITAYLATFGNVDRDGDRIQKGAFQKSIKARPTIPMVSEHLHASGAGAQPINQVVIGKWSNLREDDHGLLADGRLNLKTQAGREHFELLKDGMLDRFSMGYIARGKDFKTVEGKSVRDLTDVDLYEGSVVIFPANDEAELVSVKAADSTASIDDLPDSDFAYIEPGGKKDDEGKTTPRSLRHFPIHDAAHVRNALARAGQSPFGDKAMPKIRAAAKKFGIDASDDDGDEKASSLDVEFALAVLEAFVVKAGTEAMESKTGARNSAADQARLQLVHDMAGQIHSNAASLGADHNDMCDYDPDGDEMIPGPDDKAHRLPMTMKQAADLIATQIAARL